jgi:hypothetical protein
LSVGATASTLSDVNDTGATAELDGRSRLAAVAAAPHTVTILALLAALAVLVANVAGIASGDDGVGYRAMADSLLAGDGYGYFLEDPVTVWPPVWPALMALIAWLSPLDPLGAAIVLNAGVAAGVVVAGNRLLRVVVDDARLVLAGTVVLALGPSTIGLGHVLMTDMAFALVTMVWMLALVRFRRTAAWRDLVAAALLAWLAFGLRYVGLVLIAFGGLWLLCDGRRSLGTRFRNGVLYGVGAAIVPIAWMLRNRSIDGTFTGERNPSARGLIDNGFDIAATLGRFLLPGLGNGLTYLWAAVGLVVLAGACWLAWKVLRAPVDGRTRGVGARLVHLAGRPLGLLAGFAILYMAYMLYVRTTTALNQLDLRLLYPAYFPLSFVALALLERLRRLEPSARWERFGLRAAGVWCVANVAAGMVGMVAFAAGHPYFVGNYEADVFDAVRENPAIAALPADCQLYSNLPNGLYPAYEALWSPQRRALESSREIPDLEEIAATLDDTPSCLIWIDEPPVYGHLWTLEQLQDRLELEPVAAEGNVETFLMRQRR